MKTVELNPSGYFDTWDPIKLNELKNEEIGESFTGANLMFENNNIKLWEIAILPGERLPFSKKNNNYLWVCLTGGKTISHSADGTIQLFSIKKGESRFFNFKNKQHISDVENVGENKIVIHIIEYKDNEVL